MPKSARETQFFLTIFDLLNNPFFFFIFKYFFDSTRLRKVYNATTEQASPVEGACLVVDALLLTNMELGDWVRVFESSLVE